MRDIPTLSVVRRRENVLELSSALEEEEEDMEEEEDGSNPRYYSEYEVSERVEIVEESRSHWGSYYRRRKKCLEYVLCRVITTGTAVTGTGRPRAANDQDDYYFDCRSSRSSSFASLRDRLWLRARSRVQSSLERRRATGLGRKLTRRDSLGTSSCHETELALRFSSSNSLARRILGDELEAKRPAQGTKSSSGSCKGNWSSRESRHEKEKPRSEVSTGPSTRELFCKHVWLYTEEETWQLAAHPRLDWLLLVLFILAMFCRRGPASFELVLLAFLGEHLPQ